MRVLCFVTLLLLAGLLSPASGFAQGKEEKTFKAIVADSIDKTPLENCTVVLQGKGAKKFITNEDGAFSFKWKADTVDLLLQHVGYTEKRFLLFSKRKYSDTLFLSPSSVMMDGVVVKTKLPPIVVRGDTTEYNIDSSMFEPFDVVADLVKRLPGLEVDAEGHMTFHGKPITRILVDGEDLFGGDPNFSINKLPAGLVAKIQVMNTRTLEEIFNNIPSDGESKTLNIKLKTGNKFFGNAGGGGGTKNNLDGNGNISQFDDNKRISLTGTYNSSNKTGLFKTDGGPTASSVNAGINYGNKWETSASIAAMATIKTPIATKATANGRSRLPPIQLSLPGPRTVSTMLMRDIAPLLMQVCGLIRRAPLTQRLPSALQKATTAATLRPPLMKTVCCATKASTALHLLMKAKTFRLR